MLVFDAANELQSIDLRHLKIGKDRVRALKADHLQGNSPVIGENHLRPLFEIVVESLRELQDLGIAPAGEPALLFNMIRVSAGGLLALSEEIKGTSNIDFDSEEALDQLSDMIIRCFLPGNAALQH